MKVSLLFVVVCFTACVALVQSQDAPEKEVSEMNALLGETDVVKLLQEESDRHDKKLQDLHHRLEKELEKVHKHFEEMILKLQSTEDNIEKNIAAVEQKVLGRVQDVNLKSQESHSSWRMPFLFLMVVVAGVSAVFFRLYKKATKHAHLI